jgi:hypothetical protein
MRPKTPLTVVVAEAFSNKTHNVKIYTKGGLPWYDKSGPHNHDLSCGRCGEVLIPGFDYPSHENHVGSDLPMIAICPCGAANAVPCQVNPSRKTENGNPK